jgi:hypothetical protein
MEGSSDRLDWHGEESGTRRIGFVTPRASEGFNVYGLSIDVFFCLRRRCQVKTWHLNLSARP